MKSRQVDTTPPYIPAPSTIRAGRERAALNQIEAASLLWVDTRLCQKWELGEREMHPAFWELFCIKTGCEKGVRMPKPPGKEEREPCSGGETGGQASSAVPRG